jgi:hypothetical protein
MPATLAELERLDWSEHVAGVILVPGKLLDLTVFVKQIRHVTSKMNLQI